MINNESNFFVHQFFDSIPFASSSSSSSSIFITKKGNGCLRINSISTEKSSHKLYCKHLRRREREKESKPSSNLHPTSHFLFIHSPLSSSYLYRFFTFHFYLLPITNEYLQCPSLIVFFFLHLFIFQAGNYSHSKNMFPGQR